MLHRVFIAVNLPEEIKEKLSSFQKEYSFVPAKWVEKENIHITVLFLGNLDDAQLLETIQTSQQALRKHKSFVLGITRLVFGPEDKFPPRMIWAEVGKSREFIGLRNDIERALFGLPEYKYKQRDKRGFNPHITIARIKSFKYRSLGQKPKIDIPLNMKIEVNSVEIMESQLTKKGPEYEILKTIEL